jgi:hypothetical protein
LQTRLPHVILWLNHRPGCDHSVDVFLKHVAEPEASDLPPFPDARQIPDFRQLTLEPAPDPVFYHSLDRVVMKLLRRAKYQEHLYEKPQALDVIQVVQAVDAARKRKLLRPRTP